MTLHKSLGLLALMAGGLGLTSTASAATISGSKHDLSAMTNSGGQICISCHTPHNAQANRLVPLWNHTATATTFTLYTSATASSSPGQPTGTSKACMSCHDGTVALDSFGGKTPGSGGFITGANNLGTDMSNDHPTSITYDATLVGNSSSALVTPTSSSFVDAAKTVPLYAGKLECASCHDAHDNQYGNFLRMSNAGSVLCLKCHTK
jgi:predicted CXXCH cytochrome family protein